MLFHAVAAVRQDLRLRGDRRQSIGTIEQLDDGSPHGGGIIGFDQHARHAMVDRSAIGQKAR